LVADLLRACFGAKLPSFDEARVGSAEFTDIKPAQYHADLVVLLAGESIEHGLIVEVQLSIDPRKRYTWPMYVYHLRAQLSCPVSLVVVTVDDNVARWAEERVETGISNTFAPLVIRPSAMPHLGGESSHPDLAAVSAIMHVGDRDSRTSGAAFRVGLSALPALPADLSRVCFDLLLTLAHDEIRREWQSMDFSKYEFQSDVAKRLIAMGRAEGQAALLARQLSRRFGPLSQEVHAHLRQASHDELDLIGERVLTAPTLRHALGDHGIAA
jgi:hypothetical protein